MGQETRVTDTQPIPVGKTDLTSTSGEPEAKTESAVARVSLEIPGSQGREVDLFIPRSLSHPQVDKEAARVIVGAYETIYGMPNEPRELRLHQQIVNRVNQLLGQVGFNLRLMAERRPVRDPTIVIYQQTGEPTRADFVDYVIQVLLLTSGFQFEAPLCVTKPHRQRGMTVETEYRRAAALEAVNFPGILAFAEETTFRSKGGRKPPLVLGKIASRTISLQFLSVADWNQIRSEATE